ncbi:MAG: WD40/YVTN/BNR-like repeat-containing protein [Sphingobacteriales bacterium]
MRKLTAWAILAMSFHFTFAQTVNLNQFKNYKPRNIGPAGMSGRVVAIDAQWNNPDIVYVGTASGGVWKTENSGTTWKPVFDEQPIINIGSIAIQQSNPDVVWVGTGEGNPRNSLNIGEGIFKSLDAGKTWKRMGLEKTRNIHRVIVDPTNPNTVYAAAIGNPYSPNPERGVYKSTDGGATWEKVLYTNDTSGCADLVMDPSNPNKLFACLWQFQRTPWSSKSGGSGSGFYVTVDGGKNWKKLSKEDGMPEGNLGRIGIAISRSMPSRVYAKVEATKNGLYRSDDGGFKWELINSKATEVTDRPFYYQEIYVDPKNENRIYDIHSTVTLSEDGGKSFSTLIPYSGIHPDHHAWWINPNDANLIIEGNDGGIGLSRDRGKTWKFDEQIPVGQFYHINTDNQIPYNVMGGMQDNGSWRGPGYMWTDGGIRNYYWDNLWGGDGFDVVPDPEDNTWVYAMSQGGSVGRYNVVTGLSEGIRPPTPDAKTKMRFNWNSGIALDPFDSKTVYYGSQFLNKSIDKGTTWDIISPDLTTNDSTKQKQDDNGGLTLDITGAENYTTILAIAPSPKQKGVIWVGTDDGNVQLTQDGSKTWTNFRGKIPGMPVGAWVPQIQTSRYNAGEAFVVTNDYRRGDFKPYIFRTKDFGKTWENILANKGVSGYALCVIQDPTEPNLIFAGTEQGLWVSFDNAATWQQWKNGYPSVSTYDLTIQEREADLVIATFGRALWVLDDIRPLRKIAANAGKTIDKKVTMFEAPVAYQASFRNAPGYEWSTWGMYEGENRERGAMISFFVKPNNPKDTAAAKTKTDSVTVKVYTEANELIRTYKAKADTGFNRIFWNFAKKGVRQPGSPKPKPNSPEPTGNIVYPGTYKMVVSLGKEADSTAVVVKPDPRFDNPKNIYAAKEKFTERVNKVGTKLTEAVDRITDAEDVVKKIEAELKDMEGNNADTLRKASKAITDSLKSIRNFIFGKTDERQGITRFNQNTVMQQYNLARFAPSQKLAAPGRNEENALKIADEAINEAVQKVNAFFDAQWKNYRKLVESTQIKLFKEYTPIQ